MTGGAVSSDDNANLQDSIFWRNRSNNDLLAVLPKAGDTLNVVAPGWSSFNVMESPDANLGKDDIDITGASPGFEHGFYLVQVFSPVISPAFDSGSDPVPGFVGLDLDKKTTSINGAVDADTLDRGYHYLRRSAGIPDGVAVIEPAAPGGLTAGAATPQAVVVDPLTGSESMRAGQEVFFTVVAAPAGLVLVPVANLEPNGAGSAVATDLGAGHYQVLVDTSAAGPGTLDLAVTSNGVSLGTVSISVVP